MGVQGNKQTAHVEMPPRWQAFRGADPRSGAFTWPFFFWPGRRPALRGSCSDTPPLEAGNGFVFGPLNRLFFASA